MYSLSFSTLSNACRRRQKRCEKRHSTLYKREAMRPHERRPDGAATARGPPSSACTGTRRRAPRARPNGARQRCAGAASVRPSAAGWCRTPRRSEQSMPSRHSVDDVGGSCSCCCCCPPALARSSQRPSRARRQRLRRSCSVRGARAARAAPVRVHARHRHGSHFYAPTRPMARRPRGERKHALDTVARRRCRAQVASKT